MEFKELLKVLARLDEWDIQLLSTGSRGLFPAMKEHDLEWLGEKRGFLRGYLGALKNHYIITSKEMDALTEWFEKAPRDSLEIKELIELTKE